MDVEEIGINTRNSVDSTQDRDLLESPCECGIEPLCFISNGDTCVSYMENLPSFTSTVKISLY